MKSLLFSIIILLFSVCLLGQNQKKYSAINATIINQKAKPINNKQTLDEELNTLLKDSDVISYRFAFPHSKYPQLQKIVEIQISGDPEIFSNQIRKKVPHLLKDMRICEEDYPDIDPPNDYLYQLTLSEPDKWLWHLIKIEAQNAWNITTSSDEVKIAIIDSEFDVTHPDLENKIDPIYDPYTLISHGATMDEQHGTFVASFAGAETNGGGQLASIGYNTRLIAYRKVSSPLEEAHHASFDMGADIISYSWAGSGAYNENHKLAVKEILDNGTVIVRSAGNTQSDNDDTRRPFASQYDERIIIVSSTDKNDNHTCPDPSRETHANYPEVDLCAPGYCVMGAVPTIDGEGNPNPWPYYGCSYGTSDATPIVAGICALMKSVNPDLTPAQVQGILKATTDPISDANLYPGKVGTGRVNAYCAVLQSTPLTLSGLLNGTYNSKYLVKISNSTISNNRNVTIIGGDVTLEQDFEVQTGSTFTIIHSTDFSCN